MTAETTKFDIEALRRLLDSHGADQARWPKAKRAAAEALIARDVAALRLFAETEALDRVLGAGAGEAALDRRLAERIVAAALAGERDAGGAADQSLPRNAGNVVPLRRPAPATVPAWFAPRRSTGWQAGGLMAASLIAGMFLGGGGAFTPVIERMAEIAGISLEGDPVIALIGQEAAGQSDEDLL